MSNNWSLFYIQYRGFIFSGLFHFIIFLFLIFSFSIPKKDLPPEIEISILALPITNKTNIENTKLKDSPEKEPEKNTPLPEAQKEVASNEVKNNDKAEKKPTNNPNAEKKTIAETITTKPKENKLKPEVVQKPKIEPKSKKQNVGNSYDSLLKNLEKTISKNDHAEKIEQTKNKGFFDPNQKLSVSVRDAIRKQIEACWNPPAGHKEAANLNILLQITFNLTGEVKSVKIIEQASYNSNEAYRVAADAAVRAVFKASPLQNLPEDQFKRWENIELNFDPSNLIY